MRYHDIITEGVVYQTHEFAVFENPTAAAIKAMRAKAKHEAGLRALVTPTSLFVWDGYFLTHHEAFEKLGIPFGKGAAACIHIWNDHVEWDVADYDLSYDDEAEGRLKAHFVWITRNSILRRYYGGGVPIMADDGINEFDPTEGYNWIEFDLGD